MQIDVHPNNEIQQLNTEVILNSLNSHIDLNEKIRFVEEWALNILIRSSSNYFRQSTPQQYSYTATSSLPFMNYDLWLIYYESMSYFDFNSSVSSRKEKILECVSAVFSRAIKTLNTNSDFEELLQFESLFSLVFNCFDWIVKNCSYFFPSLQTTCKATKKMFKAAIKLTSTCSSACSPQIYKPLVSTIEILLNMLNKSFASLTAQNKSFTILTQSLLEDALILRFHLARIEQVHFLKIIENFVLGRLFHVSVIKSYEYLYQEFDYDIREPFEWSNYNDVWIVKPFIVIYRLNLQPDMAHIALHASNWLMENFFKTYLSQYSQSSSLLFSKSTVTCWLYFAHIYRILVNDKQFSLKILEAICTALSLLKQYKIYSADADSKNIRLSHLQRISVDLLSCLRNCSNLSSKEISVCFECFENMNTIDHRILKDNIFEIITIGLQCGNSEIGLAIESFMVSLIDVHSNIRQVDNILSIILNVLRQTNFVLNVGSEFFVSFENAYRFLLPTQIVLIWQIYVEHLIPYVSDYLNSDFNYNANRARNFKFVVSLFVHFSTYVQWNTNSAAKVCALIPQVLEQCVAGIIDPFLKSLSEADTQERLEMIQFDEYHLNALELHHSLIRLQFCFYYEFSIGESGLYFSLANYFTPNALKVFEFYTRVKKLLNHQMEPILIDILSSKICFFYLQILSNIVEILPFASLVETNNTYRLTTEDCISEINDILQLVTAELNRVLHAVAYHADENLSLDNANLTVASYYGTIWNYVCTLFKTIIQYSRPKKHIVRAIVYMACNYSTLPENNNDQSNVLRCSIARDTAALLENPELYEIQSVHKHFPKHFTKIIVENFMKIAMFFGVEFVHTEALLHSRQQKLICAIHEIDQKHCSSSKALAFKHHDNATNPPEDIKNEIGSFSRALDLITSLPLKWTCEQFDTLIFKFVVLIRNSNFSVPTNLVLRFMNAVSKLFSTFTNSEFNYVKNANSHIMQKNLVWVYEYSTIMEGVSSTCAEEFVCAYLQYILHYSPTEFASWIGICKEFCKQEHTDLTKAISLIEITLKCFFDHFKESSNYKKLQLIEHKNQQCTKNRSVSQLIIMDIEEVSKVLQSKEVLTKNQFFSMRNINMLCYLIKKALREKTDTLCDLYLKLDSNLSDCMSIAITNFESTECSLLLKSSENSASFGRSILNYFKIFIALLPELATKIDKHRFSALVALIYSLLKRENKFLNQNLDCNANTKNVQNKITQHNSELGDIFGELIGNLNLSQTVDVSDFLLHQITRSLRDLPNICSLVTALDAFGLFLNSCNSSFSFQVLNLITKKLISSLMQVLQSDLWPLLQAPICDRVRLKVLSIMMALIRDKFVFLNSAKLECILSSTAPVLAKQHSLDLADLLMEKQILLGAIPNNFNSSSLVRDRTFNEELYKAYCAMLLEIIVSRSKLLDKCLPSILLLTRCLLSTLVRKSCKSDSAAYLDCANDLKLILIQLSKSKLSKLSKKNLCVYLIVDYIVLLESNNISLGMRRKLSVGIYSLISCLTYRHRKAINTLLRSTGKTLFKVILDEYKKDYKFKGKI